MTETDRQVVYIVLNDRKTLGKGGGGGGEKDRQVVHIVWGDREGGNRARWSDDVYCVG